MRNRKGFTLVELSIVLVIIGLLIGGMLVGQSLIDSAKLNSQIRQFQAFDMAVSVFKQKFKRLPGDCSFCTYKPGNADGKINKSNYVDIAEGSTLINHLNEYGMLKGSKLLKSDYYQSGCNGAYFIYSSFGHGYWATTANNAGEIFYIFVNNNGGFCGWNTGIGLLRKGIISSVEAMALDQKLDDGDPYTGTTVAIQSSNTNNNPIPFTAEIDNAANCVYNSKYNISLTNDDLCRPLIKASNLY